MADLKSVTLKNVEVRWAFLAEPQTKGEYASNKYQLDVVFDKTYLDTINKLKNSRQQVKDLGDGKYSIAVKSSVQPPVMDTKKVRYSSEDMKKIGNGTIAHVKVGQYSGFKGQTFLGLQAVMVVELHEYSGADPFADIDVEVSDDDSAPFDTDDDDLI